MCTTCRWINQASHEQAWSATRLARPVRLDDATCSSVGRWHSAPAIAWQPPHPKPPPIRCNPPTPHARSGREGRVMRIDAGRMEGVAREGRGGANPSRIGRPTHPSCSRRARPCPSKDKPAPNRASARLPSSLAPTAPTCHGRQRKLEGKPRLALRPLPRHPRRTTQTPKGGARRMAAGARGIGS